MYGVVELERCKECRCHKPVGEDCSICPLLTEDEARAISESITKAGN